MLYRRTVIQLMAHFSSETLDPEDSALKGNKSAQPRILGKLTFQN